MTHQSVDLAEIYESSGRFAQIRFVTPPNGVDSMQSLEYAYGLGPQNELQAFMRVTDLRHGGVDFYSAVLRPDQRMQWKPNKQEPIGIAWRLIRRPSVEAKAQKTSSKAWG